ncbi:MAG TPA: ATP-binding protein [Gemmataceae bacterium]|nr:ATP-binding protein [Gemmataceae bacterium]
MPSARDFLAVWGSGPISFRKLARQLGVVLSSVALAAIARLALSPELGNHAPFTMFFIAVVACAAYGGFALGLAATILGAVAAIMLFAPPHLFGHGPGVEFLVGLLLYLFGGVIVCWLCESLRVARWRSEAHALRAVQRQRLLEAEVARRTRVERLNVKLCLELEDANHRKDVFLAMLAHELRNPLAPIRNAIQVMRLADRADPRLTWSRDVIGRQVDHLARLVDDLLDVSRLMRGAIRLQPRPIELAVIVADALETSKPLVAARGHELSVALPVERVRLHGDPARLAQVLVNLLNNAATYTDPGGHISLRAECSGAEVIVRVRDDGRGMPAELLPRVFDLFTQGERTAARSEGGLGVGLTLAKSLVEMHGGRIEARSRGQGLGSEFVVRLPAYVDPKEPSESRHDGDEGAAAGSRRILVVDDKPDAADSLAMLLELNGHQSRAVYDGPAALQAAAEFSPEVVLLDLGMPGMNGFEVVRRLRSQPGGSDKLVIALTGYNQEDDLRQCRSAGFDAHLCKPADLDRLNELLRSFAGLRQKQRRESQPDICPDTVVNYT